MGDREKTLREMRATIASEMVRIQSRYYGKEPTKARAYTMEDLVVVLLQATFTPAERTLIERGQTEGIRETRRRFQEAVADEFKSVVERATGREVRAFVSETDLDTDVAVELFMLGAPLAEFADPEQPA